MLLSLSLCLSLTRSQSFLYPGRFNARLSPRSVIGDRGDRGSKQLADGCATISAEITCCHFDDFYNWPLQQQQQ